MRHSRITFILVLIVALSGTARAQFEKAEVQVSGMTCSMCQMAAQKALKTIGYISEIKPELSTNSFQLVFKKDAPVNFELIKKKIKDAGFSVSRFVATYKFNKMPVSNNSAFTEDGSSYRFVNISDKVLNGNVRLMLLSNGFVTTSDFKKYAIQNADPSYKTGINGSGKVFHVTLASN